MTMKEDIQKVKTELEEIKEKERKQPSQWKFFTISKFKTKDFLLQILLKESQSLS